MNDPFYIFLSVIGLMLCVAAILIVWATIRTNNPDIEQVSHHLLRRSLLFALVPPALFALFQIFILNPFVQHTVRKEQDFQAKNQFVSSYAISWDETVINSPTKLNLITDTIKRRLVESPHLQDIVSIDALSPESSMQTVFRFRPGAITVPASQQELSDILSVAIPKADKELISVRSVLSSDESATNLRQPEASLLRWGDSVISVADSSHINDSYVLSAHPSGDNSVTVQLTDPGVLRMNAMARYAESNKVPMALLHHGNVVGVYEPTIHSTNELVIDPIQGNLTPSQAADELSMPRRGLINYTEDIHLSSLEPKGIAYSVANFINSLPYAFTAHFWLILMFVTTTIACFRMIKLDLDIRSEQSEF